jgi:hypothetical protein
MRFGGPESLGAFGLAFAAAVSAAAPAHARDIDREFRCEAGALPRDGRIRVARVKASMPRAPVVNSMMIPTDPAQARAKDETPVKTWGRCPRVPYQCERRDPLPAGEAVVVWGSMGKHVCVTGLHEAGWVEAAHLEPVPPALADWTGAYTNGFFGDLDIVAGDDGRLAVSGALIASAGEGSGVAVFELNEIPLTWVKPRDGTIVLSYRTKITAVSRGEKVQYGGGKPAPAGCTLMARLNPPLLVVRDAPGCRGEERSSGFQGIWFPRAESPEPRDDHAKGITLRR